MIAQLNVDDEEAFLSLIASQSRREIPEPVEGLFERTIQWGHDSIQEFVWYVFHVKGLSRVALAQLTRHRMASFLVKSGRYTKTEKTYLPASIRNRPEVQAHLEQTRALYQKLVEEGVPVEDARYIMPEGAQVNLFMGINGRSLRNFLHLRLHKSAQAEIRELAGQIADLVKEVNPKLVDLENTP